VSAAGIGRSPGLAVLESAAQEVREVVVASKRAVAELTENAEALGRVASHRGATERDRLAAELAGAVAERAEALRREAEQLSGVLERARAQLVRAVQPASVSAATKDAAGIVRPVEGEGPVAPVTAGVRLMISRMALAGVSRREIEERLRSQFGIVHPDTVVTEVLGSGDITKAGDDGPGADG